MCMCGLTAAATSEGGKFHARFPPTYDNTIEHVQLLSQSIRFFLKKGSDAFLDPESCFHLISWEFIDNQATEKSKILKDMLASLFSEEG